MSTKYEHKDDLPGTSDLGVEGDKILDSNPDGFQTEGSGDQPNQDSNPTSAPDGKETLDEATCLGRALG